MTVKLPAGYVPDVLVVRGRLVVGSRPYQGGRGISTYRPFGSADDGWFPYVQLAYKGVEGDPAFALALVERPGFDLVESDLIPAPFDRYREGGELLPEPPK